MGRHGARVATTAEIETKIANVEAAIDALISRRASSYTMEDGRSFTALDLDKLRAWRVDLIRELGNRQSGKRRNYSARRGS